MNTQLLTDKIADIVSLLEVMNFEAKEIETKRKALENTGHAITDRDNKLNEREKQMLIAERETKEQREYIDSQNKNAQTVLNKIKIEKEELSSLADQKREIEKERLQLEIEKQDLEGFRLERDSFTKKQVDFEEEKRLFSEEKKAMAEQVKLMLMRERNLKDKEDRLDRIERMTSL